MDIEDFIYQFRIALRQVAPSVWRRIVVPASYTFWDLHVAIQSAMGWEDRHLHEFRLSDRPENGEVRIGIPDPNEPFAVERNTLAGWESALTQYISKSRPRVVYVYDFGDGWEHEVTLEKVAPRDAKARYPACLDGAMACPPEDCGGPSGYAHLVEVLADRRHPEYPELVEWIGKRFDPRAFDARRVRFIDPKAHWKKVFED